PWAVRPGRPLYLNGVSLWGEPRSSTGTSPSARATGPRVHSRPGGLRDFPEREGDGVTFVGTNAWSRGLPRARGRRVGSGKQQTAPRGTSPSARTTVPVQARRAQRDFPEREDDG